MTLPAHLGVLHPVEQLLVVLLAFGPFVVLGVVVVLQRRRAEDEETRDEVPDEVRDEPVG
jgi:sensor domain CHASE-containing protein